MSVFRKTVLTTAKLVERLSTILPVNQNVLGVAVVKILLLNLSTAIAVVKTGMTIFVMPALTAVKPIFPTTSAG